MTTASTKVECLNPNTSGRMNIDAKVYALFSKAIYFALKKEKELTFTQMVEEVRHYLKEQNALFDGSVEWYTVAVKNDLQSKRIIEVSMQKGKKLHRLLH